VTTKPLWALIVLRVTNVSSKVPALLSRFRRGEVEPLCAANENQINFGSPMAAISHRLSLQTRPPRSHFRQKTKAFFDPAPYWTKTLICFGETMRGYRQYEIGQGFSTLLWPVGAQTRVYRRLTQLVLCERACESNT
jgi:hypothetical protein